MESAAVIDEYPVDEHPMFINLEPAMPVLQGYDQAEDDYKVATAIAGYADSKGVAWPTLRNIVNRTGLPLKRVNRSVWRLERKRLFAITKKKKRNDIHERNIYHFTRGLIRETPDMRSNHYDAKKWERVAACLKQFVDTAVDTMKQVASSVAENMSAAKKKPRAHYKRTWNQRQNNSQQDYHWNKWKQSHQEPVLTPEERQRQAWIQQLRQQAEKDLNKAHVYEGGWLAMRYIEKRLAETPEQYDSILQDAIAKFKDYQDSTSFEGRVRHGLDPMGIYGKSQLSSVQDVRFMSPDDEPTTLGNVLGGVSA